VHTPALERWCNDLGIAEVVALGTGTVGVVSVRELGWEAWGPMKTWPSVLLSVILFAGVVGACSGPKVPTPQPVQRVGLMHVGTDHNPPSLATLVAGLGDLGWFDGPASQVMQQLVGDETKVQGRMKQVQGQYDGQRIQLIWRNLDPAQPDQPDRVAEQAREFVRERVDLIVAFEDKSIIAAEAATADSGNRIPVVFLHPLDPLRDGLVKSLAHPGGNLTGVWGARDPVATQLEMYREIMPGPQSLRLLALVDPKDTATPPLLIEARAAAGKLGIKLDEVEAANDAGLEAAFQSLRPGAVDGVFILSSSLRLNYSGKILGLAAAANLPVQAHRKEWVDPQKIQQGALFSLGVDVGPVGTAGARFVDSILKGAKPADLPAQEVPKVEFALSLKRAGELGIQVPPNVVEQANPVYP
jgi:putative ABC transport system substrate-binding protein